MRAGGTTRLASPARPDEPAASGEATREALSDITPPEVTDAAQASTGDGVDADALVVDVVDPLGVPRAGVPLWLEPRAAAAHHAVARHERVTGGRGRAVFEGLRARLASDGELWVLRADLAFEEPPSLVLDTAALAAGVVRFELPPGAPLSVVVRELDGASAPEGSTVRLRLVRRGEELEPDPGGPAWKRELERGAVRFPWIELGRRWELAAWRPRGSEPTRLLARGPVRTGEGVALELVLGSDHPVVSYRVLRSDATPLVSTELELARGSHFGTRETSDVATDPEGRFTLDARAAFFEPGDFVVTWRPPEGAPETCRGRLPADPADGWNDGGDLRLRPEPILCAGRVVDGAGAPIAGASVVAGEDRAWPGGTTIHGRSDAEGRFDLRGLWIGDTFPVHASAGPGRSEDLEARQGAVDVELVIVPRFTLTGELGLDPEADAGAIRFAVEGPDGERREVARKSYHGYIPTRVPLFGGATPDTHRFELEPLAGGLYDVLFLLEGTELARRVGIALRSDLDLGRIDLTGRVAVCEIELVGSGDPSELQGDFSWMASDGGGRGQGSFPGPLVRILTPFVPLDVELRPRGYRSARLERVSGRIRHVLEPALRVRLVLHTAGVPPPPPYRFDAEPYLGDSAVGEPVGPRWFTPERRAIEWLVSTPGSLTARWHLEKKVEGDGFGGAIGTHVLDDRWVTLDVRDEPGVQEFVLELDAAALEGLVEGLDW